MARKPEAPARLFHRHRDVLALLHALGDAAPDAELHLLLALHGEEAGAKAPYHFVPLPDGPRSLTLEADLEKLEEHGLVRTEGDEWRLTRSGALEAEASGWDAGAFVRRHLPEARGPWAAMPQATRAQATAPGGPALLSIGYEGRSLEAYLDALLAAGVTMLCDVRRNPLSRKFGFSKKTLAHACKVVGIRYEHLPELGIEAAKRKGIHGEAAYAALFETYRREWLPKQRQALQQIETWLQEGERVALTCFERDETHCHRHMVAEALGEATIQL